MPPGRLSAASARAARCTRPAAGRRREPRDGRAPRRPALRGAPPTGTAARWRRTGIPVTPRAAGRRWGVPQDPRAVPLRSVRRRRGGVPERDPPPPRRHRDGSPDTISICDGESSGWNRSSSARKVRSRAATGLGEWERSTSSSSSSTPMVNVSARSNEERRGSPRLGLEEPAISGDYPESGAPTQATGAIRRRIRRLHQGRCGYRMSNRVSLPCGAAVSHSSVRKPWRSQALHTA